VNLKGAHLSDAAGQAGWQLAFDHNQYEQQDAGCERKCVGRPFHLLMLLRYCAWAEK
jgi:hypothetical protein